MNSGIDFDELRDRGIDHSTFSEHFLTSGLVLNPDIHWYGFHTDHDFAYLLRMMNGMTSTLPSSEKDF
jgi:CCR4-NOT transcription complex subunit 7/8